MVYTYSAGAEFASFGAGMVFIAMSISLIIIICYAFTPRRTEKYRKELTDLYVAGIIKQLATKDKVDLKVEYEEFKTWDRHKKKEEKDLDKAIELDLKERIDDEVSKDKKTA